MTAPSVTDRNSASCNAEPAGAPAERWATRFGLKTLHSALTERDGLRGEVAGRAKRLFVYFAPPALLREQAPAVDQIKEYARHGLWTSNTTGPVRFAGLCWCYLIAIPKTVWSRTSEWVWQRPGRFLTVAVTVKLLTLFPPVGWVVDHLIEPAVQFALWLFL